MAKITYKGPITKHIVGNSNILVFGSNTEGRHGKGTAYLALMQFGAKYGQPKGLQGQSYGIITKNLKKSTHPSVSKEFIIEQIKNLYLFASDRPDLKFYIPYMDDNNNLNAYTSKELAEMFCCETPPENIIFEESFLKLFT